MPINLRLLVAGKMRSMDIADEAPFKLLKSRVQRACDTESFQVCQSIVTASDSPLTSLLQITYSYDSETRKISDEWDWEDYLAARTNNERPRLLVEIVQSSNHPAPALAQDSPGVPLPQDNAPSTSTSRRDSLLLPHATTVPPAAPPFRSATALAPPTTTNPFTPPSAPYVPRTPIDRPHFGQLQAQRSMQTSMTAEGIPTPLAPDRLEKTMKRSTFFKKYRQMLNGGATEEELASIFSAKLLNETDYVNLDSRSEALQHLIERLTADWEAMMTVFGVPPEEFWRQDHVTKWIVHWVDGYAENGQGRYDHERIQAKTLKKYVYTFIEILCSKLWSFQPDGSKKVVGYQVLQEGLFTHLMKYTEAGAQFFCSIFSTSLLSKCSVCRLIYSD